MLHAMLDDDVDDDAMLRTNAMLQHSIRPRPVASAGATGATAPALEIAAPARNLSPSAGP